MGVSKLFWADVLIACYLITRMPSLVFNGQLSYSLFFPSQLLFSLPPYIFGYTCFDKDMRPQVSKHNPKSIKCIFFGIFTSAKECRRYSPSLGQYLLSLDVTIFENASFF